MNKIVIICFSIAFIFTIVAALVTLQFIELDRANTRIEFVKLLENEQVSENLSKAIYLGLKADSCIFKKDRVRFSLLFSW